MPATVALPYWPRVTLQLGAVPWLGPAGHRPVLLTLLEGQISESQEVAGGRACDSPLRWPPVFSYAGKE